MLLLSHARCEINLAHYCDAIMIAIASQITSLTIVYSSVYSGVDQRKHQSSASLAFVWGIHRWPVNSPHKGPVTRNMFPFDDVIMRAGHRQCWEQKPGNGFTEVIRATQYSMNATFQQASFDLLTKLVQTRVARKLYLGTSFWQFRLTIFN